MRDQEKRPMHDQNGTAHHYGMFAVNMALSLVVMYFLMFSMIEGWADFRNNLNMAYMALTMVAPMGIIMLATMRGMYRRRKANAFLYFGLTVLFVAALAGTRTQVSIDNVEFIASMIPHHSGAILMCREAQLTDGELIDLCRRISEGQRKEIEQMNAIRARLERES